MSGSDISGASSMAVNDEDETTSGPRPLPTLSTSGLKFKDVVKMFNLEETEESLWNLDDTTLVEVPVYLIDNIHRISRIHLLSDRGTRGFSRLIINQILIAVVFEMNNQRSPNFLYSESASSATESSASLVVRHDLVFKKRLDFSDEGHLLHGSPHYMLYWRKDSGQTEAKSKVRPRLIVVQASEKFDADACIGELVAYMGMIHSSVREHQLDDDASIYGAVTDGLSFRFCKIDNASCWKYSRLYELRLGDGLYIFHSFLTLLAETMPKDTGKVELML